MILWTVKIERKPCVNVKRMSDRKQFGVNGSKKTLNSIYDETSTPSIRTPFTITTIPMQENWDVLFDEMLNTHFFEILRTS